jgi:NADPH-dependent 2,4-dienoyl-CoA reductase/sulfur reductase-like enzyme
MAAAAAAASRGARVVLVDGAPRLGGQYFRQALAEPAGRDDQPPPPAGRRLPARLRHLAEHPAVELRLNTEVWSVSKGSSGFTIRLTVAAPAALHSPALVLATGASELTLPFPGWELPGVVTAGAAQALLKSQHVPIGRRVVVAGTGPFLLPVAAALAEAGARALVAEAAPARTAARALPNLLRHPRKLGEAAGYGLVLARHRVPVLTGCAVVACEGEGRVERAVLARLGPDWERRPGPGRTVPADAVCVSYGFVPRLELALQLGAPAWARPDRLEVGVATDAAMGTSVRGLFVAGELAGVAGAEVAELEGELAGHSAATYLGLADDRSPAQRQRLLRRLGASRTFAAGLAALYPLRAGWSSGLAPSTVFCRCEQVPWEAVQAAIARGATTAREVRSVTRCGMGYCQGRTCGPALQMAVSALAGRPLDEVGDLHKRPVAVPVPLGRVASS